MGRKPNPSTTRIYISGLLYLPYQRIRFVAVYKEFFLVSRVRHRCVFRPSPYLFKVQATKIPGAY